MTAAQGSMLRNIFQPTYETAPIAYNYNYPFVAHQGSLPAHAWQHEYPTLGESKVLSPQSSGSNKTILNDNGKTTTGTIC